jgi:integrase
MHDYVVFMANTGLRPDEASRLEFRDVEIVQDKSMAEPILEISVRGKRGVGYCKSMPAAVFAFGRIRDRLRPARLNPEALKAEAQKAKDKGTEWKPSDEYQTSPTDRLFPNSHRELFNTILGEEELKKDREGRLRTAYSLRHTYICFRLMEGADIYQVAKNCRTSIDMIEKFYAAHTKNMIDAAAVNVLSKRPNGRPVERKANAMEREKKAKPSGKASKERSNDRNPES